jgi:hypothetical protein
MSHPLEKISQDASTQGPAQPQLTQKSSCGGRCWTIFTETILPIIGIITGIASVILGLLLAFNPMTLIGNTIVGVITALTGAAGITTGTTALILNHR